MFDQAMQCDGGRGEQRIAQVVKRWYYSSSFVQKRRNVKPRNQTSSLEQYTATNSTLRVKSRFNPSWAREVEESGFRVGRSAKSCGKRFENGIMELTACAFPIHCDNVVCLPNRHHFVVKTFLRFLTSDKSNGIQCAHYIRAVCTPKRNKMEDEGPLRVFQKLDCG